MKNEKLKIKNGFTLIELIITLGIFVILISIAIGGFINALRNQRTAVGLMEINDNMSLVLEQMAREIRLGYNFISATGELQFKNAKGDDVVYKLNLDGDDSNPKKYSIEKGINGAPLAPITAENIKITDFKIYACGENLDSTLLADCPSPNNIQPRITLSLRITGKGKDAYIKTLGVYNEIQTTISSRQY
ncbi:MAG: prepilin-type N-terminal cleavage/methylation domain-containing protein [Patescibacteria group bacterium]|mgnify:CR=1 FL=1